MIFRLQPSSAIIPAHEHFKIIFVEDLRTCWVSNQHGDSLDGTTRSVCFKFLHYYNWKNSEERREFIKIFLATQIAWLTVCFSIGAVWRVSPLCLRQSFKDTDFTNINLKKTFMKWTSIVSCWGVVQLGGLVPGLCQ